jgi:hypothetical protein
MRGFLIKTNSRNTRDSRVLITLFSFPVSLSFFFFPLGSVPSDVPFILIGSWIMARLIARVSRIRVRVGSSPARDRSRDLSIARSRSKSRVNLHRIIQSAGSFFSLLLYRDSARCEWKDAAVAHRNLILETLPFRRLFVIGATLAQFSPVRSLERARLLSHPT